MARISLISASVEIPVYDYSAQKIINAFRKKGSGEERAPSRHNRVAALKDITLNLQDGDRLGIVGPNGAGKTTLLRVLTGVYSPTSGTVDVDGKISSLLDISFGIEPDLTGRESILMRTSILGIPKKDVVGRIDEIVEFSGLGPFIDMPTRTYSSGMFVRLAFSIATILTPEILIMDEWLSVGDETFKSKAEDRLAKLVSATKILVLASHSRHLIESSCNKAIWLDNGKIKVSGSAKEVCAAYFQEEEA